MCTIWGQMITNIAREMRGSRPTTRKCLLMVECNTCLPPPWQLAQGQLYILIWYALAYLSSAMLSCSSPLPTAHSEMSNIRGHSWIRWPQIGTNIIHNSGRTILQWLNINHSTQRAGRHTLSSYYIMCYSCWTSQICMALKFRVIVHMLYWFSRLRMHLSPKMFT